MIDQTASLTLIAFLDSRFGGRRRVRVKFTRLDGTKFRAHYSCGCIYIGKHEEVQTVLHEYAHHVDALINKPSKGSTFEQRVNARKLGNARGHTESFYYNLRKVIEVSGFEYNWKREYHRIQQWAKRDGLL